MGEVEGFEARRTGVFPSVERIGACGRGEQRRRKQRREPQRDVIALIVSPWSSFGTAVDSRRDRRGQRLARERTEQHLVVATRREGGVELREILAALRAATLVERADLQQRELARRGTRTRCRPAPGRPTRCAATGSAPGTLLANATSCLISPGVSTHVAAARRLLHDSALAREHGALGRGGLREAASLRRSAASTATPRRPVRPRRRSRPRSPRREKRRVAALDVHGHQHARLLRRECALHDDRREHVLRLASCATGATSRSAR